MKLFSLVIQPTINELQAACVLNLNIWRAENGMLVGTISNISKTTEILQATGATLGYYLEVGKSNLWWPTVDLTNI